MKKWACGVLVLIFVAAGAVAVGAMSKDEVANSLIAEKVSIPLPKGVLMWPEKKETVATTEGNDNVLTVKYKTVVWGDVVADFDDFKQKVAETLNDKRGWVRAGIKFEEVNSGQDLDVILSDPAHLEALNGCSGELSCTTWNNQVIINDVRWREGTEPTRAVGMGQRDYQHMVVNHEMGHWLGHYAHVESCPNGGPAPLMLQQSTGMRGCDTFNAWPLEWELWTNKK